MMKAEREKLRQRIISDSQRERCLKLITEKVQYKEGALSAKPNYRYEQFKQRMARSPSFSK